MTEVGMKFVSSFDMTNILSIDEVGEAGVKLVADSNVKSGSVWFIHMHGEEPFEVPDKATWDNLLKYKND